MNSNRKKTQKRTYFHCTRCCGEANINCLNHKQQIEKFFGSEIDKIPIRKRFRCTQCTKMGFSEENTIKCEFCQSERIQLI